jgi:hypothetical protein
MKGAVLDVSVLPSTESVAVSPVKVFIVFKKNVVAETVRSSPIDQFERM